MNQSIFLKAAAQNRAGAILLSQGEYQAAEPILQQSLLGIQRFIGSLDESANLTSTLGATVVPVQFDAMPPCAAFIDEVFYVFPHALAFDPPAICQVDSETATFYGSMMVFNIAMAYHIYGLETGKVNVLQKAMRLYNNALQLVPEAAYEQDLLPEAYYLVRLAASTNMAHICLKIGEFIKAQELLAQVKDSLSSIAWVFASDETAQFYGNIELLMEPMILNALVSSSSPCVAPAA